MTKQTVIQRFSSGNPINPIDAEKTLSPEQWRSMFESIVAIEVVLHGKSAPPLRRKSTRLGALVAAALAIAIVVPTLWPDGLSGASPAAADALHRAADASRSQRALPAPGPGEYLYQRSEEQQTSMHVPGSGFENFLFTETTQVEDWTSQDGSGRGLFEPSVITFPTAADEAAWRSAGQPQLADGGRDSHDAAGTRNTVDIHDVPTDPEELLAAIESREIIGGDAADWVTFQIIGELLQYTYYSPEHRAALYEVAANFPGVEYEGRITDPLGRSGASVSYDGGGIRWQLIFDPDTAELLGVRHVLLKQEEGLVDEDTWPGTSMAYAGPPGTIVWWEVFERTAVVGSTNERP